jgi:pimeloyl-ACP methyl ester carboxylesterase
MMSKEHQAQDMFVTANGLRLHYREWGDAGSPGVLLLHGLTGNAWEWDPIAAALADRFHVLAVDQRGHGASAWASDYAADHMVTDISATIQALGLERVSVVGHSMGGINAYLCAALHPDLVDRLVIVDIGPESITAEAAEYWDEALRGAVEATYADVDEALAEWLAVNPRAREPELRYFVVHNLRQDAGGRWAWRFDADHLSSFIDSAPSAVAQWTALRRVACPTLVIRGAESEVLSAETASRMTQELSQGSLVEIPNGAHDLTVEQPEALAANVLRFLTAA